MKTRYFLENEYFLLSEKNCTFQTVSPKVISIFHNFGSYVKLWCSSSNYAYSHYSPFTRKSVASSRLLADRPAQFRIRNFWYESVSGCERAPESGHFEDLSDHPKRVCLDTTNSTCHQFSADLIKKQKCLLQTTKSALRSCSESTYLGGRAAITWRGHTGRWKGRGGIWRHQHGAALFRVCTA